MCKYYKGQITDKHTNTTALPLNTLANVNIVQKAREISLPTIFVLETQVRLMRSVCLSYWLFKMKDECLQRGTSHSPSLIYTQTHTSTQQHTTINVLGL